MLSLPRRRVAIAVAAGVVGLLLLGAIVRPTPLGHAVAAQVTHVARSVGLFGGRAGADQDVLVPSADAVADHPYHPARRLAPYFAPEADSTAVDAPAVLRQFHDLLRQFSQRQAVDGNFMVRALDRRTNETLAVVELDSLRTQYRRTGRIDWRAVDDRRRVVTERLVDTYAAKGVPIEDIIVRWGRAHQVRQAHERNAPYAAYEARLARSLDLSLLATELATVETFNQDTLVSPAGARSRYQLMPWLLRKNGVNAYELSTTSGTEVEVHEEYHPLLTLRPAFLLLKGYANAVGHELPGLSAYHAGPGNIFTLYRLYLTESGHFSPRSTVADAYAWAVTEGFAAAREASTFGPYSRKYVPSLYGALVARDGYAVDSSQTLRTARVQIRTGRRVTLRRLLTALDTTDRTMDWGPTAAAAPSIYHRFRALNPHLALPPDTATGGVVPPSGNVRLVASVDGAPVQFFLPPDAPDALQAAGLDVLAPNATFRFDDTTFAPPADAQRTVWDHRYAALIEDIERFGFTPQNRERLLALHEKFETLAEQRPSPYRRRQLRIIQVHERLWRSAPWEDLSALTVKVRGRVPAQPPVPLPSGEDAPADSSTPPGSS